MDDYNPRLFGSLVSLLPSLSFSSNIQERKRLFNFLLKIFNIIIYYFSTSLLKRSRNDEYTSITDAIDIDNLLVTNSSLLILPNAVLDIESKDNFFV